MMIRRYLLLISLITVAWTWCVARELSVVFIGNSITRGALLENRETEAPPVQASRYMIENSGMKVNFRNCGVSGMTTLNYLPVSNQEFPNVVRAADELGGNDTDLIFSISLGTNDSACSTTFGAPVAKEVYYTNMQAIINELLRLYPDSRVVIQTPIWYSPNTYNSAMYLNEGLKRLQSYIPMLHKLVEYYAKTNPGHVFIGDTEASDVLKDNYKEYFTPEKGNAGTFYLHPNKAGAAILGEYWAKAIMRIL